MSEYVTFLTGDYKILQDDDKYLFSADSVLLANLSSVGCQDTVVDLGTGSGVLATLLVVKKNAKKVVGVEIDSAVCDMARRSVGMNRLEDKIEILHGDVRKISEVVKKESFDKAICNPPYYFGADGTEGYGTKAVARKELEATLDDFISAASYSLKNGGDLFVSYKFDRLCDLFVSLRGHGLEPKKIVLVYPKLSKGVDTVIVSARKGGKTGLVPETLVVMDEDGRYTPEVKKLYD